MNYMNQVAEMLGVGMDEEFSIHNYDFKYKLSNGGLYFFYKNDWDKAVGTLVDLLDGNAKIVKPRWRPLQHERFFFVDIDGSICSTGFEPTFTEDELLARVGNCYRTRGEITPEIVKGWANWYNGGDNPSEVTE